MIQGLKWYFKLLFKNIVITNGKIVWEHGPYCWHFCFNLKYLGWPYRAYIKTAKNGDFCEELLNENDFEAVWATFCCYDHGAKAFEAVQKITTDQKKYRKCSSCVIICYPKYTHQSIIVKNVWLQGYLRRSWKSWYSCTEKRAITGSWWVLFIIEVRWLGWGISSKPKEQNSKQQF